VDHHVSIVYSSDLPEAREFNASIVLTRTNKSFHFGFFYKQIITQNKVEGKTSTDPEGHEDVILVETDQLSFHSERIRG
jgi:hypothetical protein